MSRGPKAQERHISLVAGLTLIVVTVVSGLSIFYLMQRQSEDVLSASLQLSLQGRIQLVTASIEQHIANTRLVATRPFIIDQILILSRSPGNANALHALNRAARSFQKTGFSSIQILDARGDILATAGNITSAPALTVPLKTTQSSYLLWNKGFLLRSTVSVMKGAKLIARVQTEAPLRSLTRMLTDPATLGKTGDLAFCGPLKNAMQCFPTSLQPRVFTHLPRVIRGKTLPMAYALDGKSGFLITQDYRHKQVVAAYAPVSGLGLGAVLKIDTEELYQPIWSQVKQIGPLLIVFMAFGVLLLRWLMSPLVRQLIASERSMRLTNARLHDSETRTRAVLENIDEGIIVVSADGLIDSINPAASRMLRETTDALTGRNISTLLPQEHARLFEEYRQQSCTSTSPSTEPLMLELDIARRDSARLPVDLRVRDMQLAGQKMFIATVQDISQRKATENEMMHIASHDALTDLPNRNLLQDRIEQAIAGSQRNEEKFAVIFIDLDDFKTINDSLGHDVGDKLLQSVAQRLQGCLRSEDTVARQGGDEFIVVLRQLRKPAGAAVAAGKLLTALAEVHRIAGHELHTAASLGIALYPDDGRDADTLLKNSDTAMYHAKEAGRSHYQFFTPAMNARTEERLSLESRLRRALASNEFTLHYQPIINIEGGQLTATEALLRWPQANQAPIPPDRFIPVAENTNLIVPLGEWVFRHACQQARAWREIDIAPWRVVINLSPRQLRQKNLVKRFSAILAETGARPEWLGLEITESVMLDNPDAAIHTMSELREMGMQCNLDDFGTGYSSLNYLKRLPIDKLKIDQSFVRDIVTDPDDAALVTTIITLAHNLKIRVIAEGVETAEQLQFLGHHGCEEYQGYYYSKPVPADALLALITPRSQGTAKR